MKKGFTLIELLAVIIVLGVIGLITYPTVNNVIKNSKEKALDETISRLEDVAHTYLTDYDLGSEKDADVINFSDLYENGYIKELPINPITNEELNGCIVYKWDGNQYDFKYSEGCELTDSSCFTYEDNVITTYDINYEACENMFINVLSYDTDLDIVCTGGTNDEGMSIELVVNSGLFSFDDLISNNVISNFQTNTNGIKITGYTCGGYYNEDDDYHEGTEMNPIIPSKIDNKDVVVIGQYSFSPYDSNWNYDSTKSTFINSITIPDSVTSIGIDAFLGNQLTSVTIPNSVTSIGIDAFSSNQLTSVTIPDSVTSIGIDAFSSNQLTSVTIPDSVTSIGIDAFLDNELISVTIPNSVIYIGDSAFQSNQLTSITIPDSVTSIGNDAFRYNQLNSIIISNSVTSIGDSAFQSNQLTSVTIPNSVTSIGWQAFAYNYILQGNATIDNASGNVTISSYAFANNGSSQTTTITPVYLR